MKKDPVPVPLALVTCGLLVAACVAGRGSEPTAAECLEAELCDGETKLRLDAVPETREEGLAVANAMMAAWKAKNPGIDWEADVRSRHWIAPSHDNSPVLGEGQGAGHPGRAFNERDLLVWKRETERMVVEGARIFHSGDELRSTIAVSCDMCHPDAANTPPETYPKYQVQMGETVLLRDMINWCLEHPVRAERMAEDDPRMRALEAYIYAQRTGTPLAYGKH
jgi:cytochrome c553